MDRRWLALVTATLLVGACTSNATDRPPGTDSIPTAPPSIEASPTAAGTGLLPIDAGLLGVLPAEVDGLSITEAAEVEQSVVNDPALAKVAAAVAAGIAVDQAAGEFVYAVVVRVRPGALDDDGYRSWRDSYDEGACSQADGVVGNAETEVDGRTVYIGSCAGGLLTYHVWLEAEELLISASALGERRLGEHLVENLRP